MSENEKKQTPLQEAMVLVAQTYQPSSEAEANGLRSTSDFISMLEEHLGSINNTDMIQVLTEMGYQKTFIKEIGFFWFVKINE